MEPWMKDVYEQEFLEHSAKGTKWKDHKYIAKKNGRYIYPGTSKEKKELVKEVVKDVGEYQNPDLFEKDANGKPIPARERAAAKRRQQRLEKRQMTEQAATNSLRRNSVARAKANGAAQTEKERAWKATVRRKESVDRAKANGAAVTKAQDTWKRQKAYADRVNAAIRASKRRRESVERARELGAAQTEKERAWRATVRRKQSVDRAIELGKTVPTKKESRVARAKNRASKAWNKFKGMKFKKG